MRTFVMEGKVIALSSVTHNGGEQNGTTAQLRREKFVQPDGNVEAVPVISGNSIRGVLRDVGMKDMLVKLGYGVNEDGSLRGLSLNAFYFFFSGGALSSTGSDGLNIERYRELKKSIPLVGVFGGASGNAIMPGKLKVNKMIPICRETAHLLPEQYVNASMQSIWDYCQTEMYTRKDDEKNDKVRNLIAADDMNLLFGGTDKKEITKSSTAQQMMYHTETFAAGTQFYWKITLEDPTELEFEAFIQTMVVYSRAAYIGGKSATGHGEIAIKMDNWIDVDSRNKAQGTEVAVPLLKTYNEYLRTNSESINALIKGIV